MNRPRMLPEPRRLLIEALRSGEYSQTRGHLRDGDGHCCLGVLCEVAIKNGVDVKVEPPYDEAVGDGYAYDGATELPPPAVVLWAYGVETNEFLVDVSSTAEHPYFEEYDEDGDPILVAAEMVELNDSDGWTFEQIADALEAEWLRDG